MNSAKERYYELDLLRFLAAISVVFFHYAFRGFSADGLSIVRFDELASIAQYGGFGVNLFFIISGYVILLTAASRGASGFVISRIARLFPAYWFAVVLTTAMTLLLGRGIFDVGLKQFLINLTMISSLFGVTEIDGVYWTLLVEIKFYFFIFLLLITHQINRVMWFLNSWFLISVLHYFGHLPPRIAFIAIPEQAPCFIAGAVFYLSRLKGYDANKVLLLTATLVLNIFVSFRSFTWFYEHYGIIQSEKVVTILLISFYAVFFLFSIRQLEFLNKPTMCYLGILTYPLYLIHQNIGYMIFNALGESFNRWFLIFLIIIIMIIAAYVIHVYVEKPGSRFLKAISSRLLDFR